MRRRFLKTTALAFESVFPGVRLYAVDYDSRYYAENLYSDYSIAYPDNVKGAAVKRQAEFLAGRYAARQVLKAFGFLGIDVPCSGSRAPVWPDGIVASITHCQGTAICAAAKSDDCDYLGIDLESVLSLSVANDVKDIVVNQKECRLIAETFLPFEVLMTLVFSVKESVYKALFPYVQYFFGFDAVEISHICPISRTLTVRLTTELNGVFFNGMEVKARFQLLGNRVLTCVYKGPNLYDPQVSALTRAYAYCPHGGQ